MFSTHLTVLETSASRHPSAAAFRTPLLNETGQVQEWNTITYEQFHSDVQLYARYWSRTLKRDGIPLRSVVGLWYVMSAYFHATDSHIWQ